MIDWKYATTHQGRSSHTDWLLYNWVYGTGGTTPGACLLLCTLLLIQHFLGVKMEEGAEASWWAWLICSDSTVCLLQLSEQLHFIWWVQAQVRAVLICDITTSRAMRINFWCSENNGVLAVWPVLCPLTAPNPITGETMPVFPSCFLSLISWSSSLHLAEEVVSWTYEHKQVWQSGTVLFPNEEEEE